MLIGLRSAGTAAGFMLAAAVTIFTAAKLARFTPAVAMYHATVFAAFFGIYLSIPFDKHFYVPNNAKLNTADIAYYTMVTHSGAGYGDIYPITTPARLLVTAHMFMCILAVFNMVPVGTSTLSYGAFPGA